MPLKTKPDARQIIDRDLLQQLFPYIAGKNLDTLLKAINDDLTVPLRVDASNPVDLQVHIGPSTVLNSISARQKSIPHIQNLIPIFASGTITFPSVNGGTISVVPGSNTSLTCPINNYVKILISLDNAGNLVVTQGTPNATENLALVPPPVSGDLPVAYVSLFNNAGTISNVAQNKIYQFGGGGGTGSSSVQAGFAQEVPVSNGSTSVSVVFPSALPGTNYVVLAQFLNTSDPNPQFQDITITNKTTSGFIATWNAPVDSANYTLSYIVPTVQEQVGEGLVPNAASSVTITLPIALAGSNYSVIAQLVNIVDGSPQFQAVTVTAKTNTTFTVEWNSPTDSSNYRLAYHVAQYQ